MQSSLYIARCQVDNSLKSQLSSNFLVRFVGKPVERQKTLGSTEAEMAVVVVGEIPRIAAVTDDERMHKAEQRARRREHIRRNDLLQQSGELAVCELHQVECLEFLAKV